MERENEADYLKQVNIFKGLDDQEVHDLMSVAKKRTFRSGEVIFHRDDPGQVLYIIKEGKVKICLISPDGQEISLVVFGIHVRAFGNQQFHDSRVRRGGCLQQG